KRHNKAIEAAYSKAPFYEFYIDEFSVFWQNEYHSLFDLDIAITERIMEVIGISSEIKISDRFYPTGSPDVDDYRNLIHPKSRTPHSMFHPHPYVQVFEDRIPFIPDLSILDLIFCTGPDTLGYLQKCHN
ncbi:MAG: WbqC family protein, partial [Bacteroidales bacterium]|nr:WbqC family protein [Bacteroidales bacterium]